MTAKYTIPQIFHSLVAGPGEKDAIKANQTLFRTAGAASLLLCALFAGANSIQAAPVAASGASLEKWRAYDFQFTSSAAHANQFQVTMTATFTGPGGRTLAIPGFYTRSNTWVVRFSPTAEGSWSYSTSSTDSQLSNNGGTIACLANANPNVHGAIQIDPENPRHYKYEDGTRYFQLGYEIDWLAMMDFGDTNVTKTRSIIDVIVANGFNEVTMALFANDTPWKAGITGPYDFGPSAEFPWEYSGTKNPSSNKFNQAYWENLDRVIDYLCQKGVTAHIYLRMQPNKYDSGMYVSYQSAQENLLFQYAIARYQAYPNVVWDFEKELNSRASTSVIVERLQFIKSLDGYKRLRTVHDADPFSRDTTANKNMDFYTDQNHPGQNGGIYACIISQRGYMSYPILNAEYGYQVGNDGGITYSGGTPSAGELLQRTCEIYMAGGYPAYYYTYHGWDVIRWNETPNALNHFLNLANFFKSTKWFSLSPDDSLIGGGSIGKHCLANPGSEYIVYLQSGIGSVSLTIGGASSGTPLAVRWVDLNSGVAQTMANVGNGTSTFTKPSGMSSSPAMLHVGGAQLTYTLTTSATNGSVALSPSGGAYSEGTVVTVTANPNGGYAFANWSGDLGGTVNPTTITMNTNKSVTANYLPDTTAPGVSITAPTNGASFATGSVVNVIATVTDNAAVQSGELYVDGVFHSADATPPYAWTVSGLSLGAHGLAVRGVDTSGNAATNSLGIVIVSQPPSAVIAADNFDSYTTGTLAGQGAAGNGWAGAWAVPANSGLVVDTSVTGALNFTPVGGAPINGGARAVDVSATSLAITLTRQLSSAQTGTFYMGYLIRWQAGTFDTTDTCSFHLANTATSTATGNYGYRGPNYMARISTPDGGGGAAMTTPATTHFLVAKFEKTSAGNFNSIKVWLDPGVNSESTLPNGNIQQTGDQTINSISWLCLRAAALDADDTVRIDQLVLGANWSDVVPGAASPVTYTLTTGATNGSITLNPPGGVYNTGTVVTVTATPGNGYAFSTWNGDLTGSTNPATITMNGNKGVTANFAVSNGTTSFRVNCGGSAYTAGDGTVFESDRNYDNNAGNTFSTASAISGTTNGPLYQSERWGNSFGYGIPMINGAYNVTLMFAEINFNAANSRVFNVAIEGIQVITNLDIWAKVGKNAAYNETHVVTVSDGQLNIAFSSVVENAKISAIRVERIAGRDIYIQPPVLQGGQLKIEWVGGGTLQTATSPLGLWNDVAGALSPYLAPTINTAQFFRVKQ